MLSTSLLTSPLISWTETIATTSALTKHLRSVSSTCAAAAGTLVSTTEATSPLTIASSHTLAVDSTSTTSMSCSPPRTYTRTSHYTRTTLTVPTAALTSSKTRRRRHGGSGGDEDIGGYDGGNHDNNGGGNNDDGDGGDNGGGEWHYGPSDDSHSRLYQDMVLLWALFCTWSSWNAFQYVTKQKQPTPAFAAVSCAHLALRANPSSISMPASVVSKA